MNIIDEKAYLKERGKILSKSIKELLHKTVSEEILKDLNVYSNEKGINLRSLFKDSLINKVIKLILKGK